MRGAALDIDPLQPSDVCNVHRDYEPESTPPSHRPRPTVEIGSTPAMFSLLDIGLIPELEPLRRDYPADYREIREHILEEYSAIASRSVLENLVEKVIILYQATAPNASPEAASALCRLQMEWWIINSVLDHKHITTLSPEYCKDLMLDNIRMFEDRSTIRPPEHCELLQRGFAAVASIVWERPDSTHAMLETIATEFRKYIDSRFIGKKARSDSFDTLDDVIRARCDDGGMVAQVLITEAGAGSMRIVEQMRTSPALREALDHLGIVATLTNDIASTPMDLRTQSLSTVQFLYQRSIETMPKPAALQSALETVAEIIKDRYGSFLASLDRLKALEASSSNDAREQHSSYLEEYLHGYWQWQMSCSSYYEPNHPVAEFRQSPGT